MSETTSSSHHDVESQREVGIHRKTEPPLPGPRLASGISLALLGATNVGIGGVWALLFALATPYFETALGSGPVLSHAVWLVGPLTGLCIAPIVGALADSSKSPYAHRRHSIVIGTLVASASLLVFANAQQFATMLLPRHLRSSGAMLVAVSGFASCIAGLNWAQWPARGLMGDLVPRQQQHALQARLIVAVSLADLICNVLAQSFAEPVSHVQFIFGVGALLFLTSKGMLLMLARRMRNDMTEFESDANGDGRSDGDGDEGSVSINAKGWVAYVRGMPRWMWHVGLTATTGGFMMFCTRPTASSWLARSVLHADPTAAAGTPAALLYESGVRAYSRASVCRALVQIAYSLAYPSLISMDIPPSYLVGGSHAVSAGMLLAFSGTRDVMIAQWVIVSTALPTVSLLAATNSVIVAQSSERRRGVNLGIINCFAVVAQLIDTGYTGFLSRAFGESAVMMIAGLWGLATAVVAFVFQW